VKKPAKRAKGGVVKYGTGARRSADVEHLRLDLIPPAALEAQAQRYALGLKYGEGNYLKGIRFGDVYYHAMAHLLKFWSGSPGEDSDVMNLAAVVWGCNTMIEYIRRGRTDLDNRLFKDGEPVPPRIAKQMERKALAQIKASVAALSEKRGA
jgi:hypothetical protein